MDLTFPESVWHAGLVVIPLTIIVVLICRVLPCRPSTRHMMWLTLLLSLLVVPFLPSAPAPDLGGVIDAMVADRQQAEVDEVTESPARPMDVDPLKALDDERSHLIDAIETAHANQFNQEAAAVTDADSRVVDHPKPQQYWESRSQPRPDVSELLARSYEASEAVQPFLNRADSAPSSGQSIWRDAMPPAADRERTFMSSAPIVPRQDPRDTRTFDQPSEANQIIVQNPGASPAVSDLETASSSLVDGDAGVPVAPHHAATENEDAVAAWLVFVKTVRDAVVSIPSIPLPVWAGGALLFVLITGIRMLCFRRLLTHAVPASELTEDLVRRTAESMGLRRTPSVLMVADRVSPMVCCSFQVQLLLPRGLWRQLDDQGREAVVAHELAHLKRRDHWVCWIELIAQFVYWWHPLVWIMRRRLAEEADLSCDAWVTTLLPRSRRQYATALLETKSFTSAAYKGLPVMALNVSSTHAKRFARRITMVMSHQTRPQFNFVSIALAASIAAAGWLATPTIACDDEKKERARAAEVAATLEAELAASLAPAPEPTAAPDPLCPPDKKDDEAKRRAQEARRLAQEEQRRVQEQQRRVQEEVRQAQQEARRAMEQARRVAEQAMRERAETDPESTFEDFMRSQDDGPRDGSMEERLRRLEEEVRMLRDALQRMRQQGAVPGVSFAPLPDNMPQFVVATPDGVSVAPMAAQNALALVQGDACCAGVPAAPAIVSLGMNGSDGVATTLAFGPTTSKKYTLDKGKLEAVTELMARSDVPIMVSLGDGHIEVHATEPQHQIFQAFCLMIDTDNEKEIGYELSEGKLHALTDLMARSDVPIYIRRGNKKITVIGNPLEQAIFSAFVDMLNGKGSGPEMRFPTAPPAPVAPRAIRVPAPHADAIHQRVQDQVNRVRARYAEEMNELHVRSRDHQDELQHLRQHHREMLNVLRDRERDLRRSERSADQIEQRAEELRDRLHEAEDRIDGADDNVRERLEVQMQNLMEHLHSLEIEHATIEDVASQIEAESHEIELEAEDLEMRMEDIQDIIEELTDVAADLELELTDEIQDLLGSLQEELEAELAEVDWEEIAELENNQEHDQDQ